MTNQRTRENAAFLTAETQWLSAVMARRLERHFSDEDEGDILAALPPADIADHAGPYREFLERHGCSPPERLVLILALLPHIAPELLDPLLLVNQSTGHRFTEFGGRMGDAEASVIPTLQTAIFLLAGTGLERSLTYRERLESSPLFGMADALLEPAGHGDAFSLRHELRPTPEAREMLLWDRLYYPPCTPEFPAGQLTTALEWDDLVLPEAVRERIDEILRWIEHSRALLDDGAIRRRIAPGYRALFSGPPGTGKTLTATLIGKASGRTVFRIDMSQIVSSHVGETERNLATLFDRAQHRDWILFFDEADALFGKRGGVGSAGDRAANHNVSYLLQRIETFEGVVILASHLQGEIDQAFMRRFQSVVEFPIPDRMMRERLWEDIFAQQSFPIDDGVDWPQIARNHEVSGGQIVEVLRHCCLMAVSRDPPTIMAGDIVAGIRRELAKAGRTN